MNSPVFAENPRAIVYFVAVANAGSFTVAANDLGVSKSALGKSIAKLEQHLATKLLYRTTRKLILPAVKALSTHCRRQKPRYAQS